VAIRVKADDLGYAILLKEIGSREDAINLREFFTSNGVSPEVCAVSEDEFHIMLYGVSCDTFVHLVAGADIELA
jgi:hypothetical protein